MVQTMLERGELAAAQRQLGRLLVKPTFDLPAGMLMSVVSTRLGEPAKGEYWARKCLNASPTEPGAHANLVSALVAQKKFTAAIDCAHLAATAAPESSIVAALLPLALSAAKRRVEASRAVRDAIDRFPDEERVYNIASSTMLDVGRSDVALQYARRAVERWPDNPQFASDLIRALAYAQDHSAGVAEAAATYQRAMATGVGPSASSWKVDSDPDRPLHVGILSGDLRDHSVMFWAGSFFRHTNRSQIRVSCYCTSAHEDDITAEVRAHSENFRKVAGFSPAALCDLIINDRVDVLLDLSGHTPGQMLAALHLKPAPLIMHWIAFPGSIGLRAVDCRIADAVTDPPDEIPIGPDKPLRIEPCYVPFTPARGYPDVVPGPLARGESPTFGSISSIMKVTDEGLALWARVIHAVPGARLYFKSQWLNDELLREDVLQRLCTAGMPRDRVILDGPSPNPAAAMACYSNFDVALDTYPYHGMTTTCESTWMGVPTVTLAGKTTASRVGCSLLHAMGLQELIARSPDEFVAIAVRLAANPERLARWRSNGTDGLRSRMELSPLRDEVGHTRRLEAAIREQWRAWCAAQGARTGAAPR